MARTPKSSKGSTKQSEKTDQPATEETKAPVAETGSDAPKTESPGSETASAETDGPVVIDEDPPTETRVGDEGAADLGDTAKPADDTGSDDVPGVVPASVESVEPPRESPTPPTPPAPPTASGTGTFSLVFGGLVAGAIGFLVATFAVPEGWPNSGPSGMESIESALDAQSERLDTLSDEIEAILGAANTQASGAGSDAGPLLEQITELEAEVGDVRGEFEDRTAEIESRLAELETRLTSLESRPERPTGPDGSAAMEAQLEEFRQQLDQVTADAEARIAEAQDRASQIEAEAAEAAAAAERDAALASIRAALDSGSAFTDDLAVFSDPPEALKVVSDTGVPTLSGLQASFPSAARSALAEAQTVPENASAGDRFMAFLKQRTNARSLSPREGDDADAILSRAEAALAEGDLDTALGELRTMPEPARAAMSDWIESAEVRVAAMEALTTLQNETN